MKPDFSELYTREKQVFHIVNKIERRGLAFDYEKAKRKNLTIKRKIKKLESKMDGVNPNSPVKVLSHLQFLGMPDKLLMKKGKLTTEGKTLQQALTKIKKKKVLDFVSDLLEYRALKKISGTYLEPLAKKAEANNGIIHCSINPTDTRTGRPASRSPNLLNIPESKVRRTGRTNPVRECFIVRPGFVNYYFDYVQQEMGIFGLLANDERIIKGYASGEDIHDYMARIIWPQYDSDPKFWRGVTKNVNFGIIYGMGIRTMALLYELKESDARRYYNIYMEEFPSVREFQEECRERLELDGCVWDWFGRRYCIPAGESYKAVNALVQGSCAQIFKIALIKLDALYGDCDTINILLTVYDEFQTEMMNNTRHELSFCKEVISCMVEIPQLIERNFKLRVDVEKSETNWADKKKLEV